MNDYRDDLLSMLSLTFITQTSSLHIVSLSTPDLGWIWICRPYVLSCICEAIHVRPYSNVYTIASKIRVTQGNIIVVKHNFCLLFWQSKVFHVVNFLSRIFLVKQTLTLPIRAQCEADPSAPLQNPARKRGVCAHNGHGGQPVRRKT